MIVSWAFCQKEFNFHYIFDGYTCFLYSISSFQSKLERTCCNIFNFLYVLRTVVMKWLVVLYSLMIVASVSFKLCFPELMIQTALSLFSGSASLLFSLQVIGNSVTFCMLRQNIIFTLFLVWPSHSILFSWSLVWGLRIDWGLLPLSYFA